MSENSAERADSGEPLEPIGADSVAPAAMHARDMLRAWGIVAAISLSIAAYLALSWTAIGPPLRALLGALR